jgi:hypothetical protein
MSTTGQIREVVKAQPFRPFTLRLADGRSYTVTHPEFAMMAPSGMELVFVGDDEAIHMIYVPLIVEIEFAGVRASQPGSEGNGA